MQAAVFQQPDFPDYALLDSGSGEKLERYGPVVVRRPDPQAVWRPRLPAARWDAADLAFERDPASGGRRGHWVAAPGVPRRPEPARAPTGGPASGRGPSRASARGGTGRRRGAAVAPRAGAVDSVEWTIGWGGARALLRPTSFKHVGMFPEQASNWDFVAGRLRAGGDAGGGEPARLLNLFGYTGFASVLAARAGVQVTHVDASRTSIGWARENAQASGLGDDALRVVVEDALSFARRAARRGETFDGILLDPPHHGKGPRGERWQFEEHAAELVEQAGALLAPDGFLVLSTYAFGTSPLALEGLLFGLPGDLAVGELALREEDGGRLLPCGSCARLVRGRYAR